MTKPLLVMTWLPGTDGSAGTCKFEGLVFEVDEKGNPTPIVKEVTPGTLANAIGMKHSRKIKKGDRLKAIKARFGDELTTETGAENQSELEEMINKVAIFKKIGPYIDQINAGDHALAGSSAWV